MTIDRALVSRIFWVLVGIALIGLGSATLRVAQVGVDPYTAANIGISHKLGLDLGAYQLISNIVLFIPMLIWGRKYIGIGSILNMVLTGFMVQWFTALLDPLVPDAPQPWLKTLLFAIGIAVFCLGAAMYMQPGLGTAPYDAVAPMIVDHSKAPYRAVRGTQDVFFLLLAAIFHGQIGPGTVVTAFFTGPLIQYFTRTVTEPLMRKAQAADAARADLHAVTARNHF
ncbi:YczE/YyaS/YitT family protein [Branchiibius cervicis]|uniref:YitT family protein n=1 Tax=Branchiibius cervicis TaxID=908252 RepID=A0ABW2AQY0_9MICO